MKLKSLGPARLQLKLVQVQNECNNKKAYTRNFNMGLYNAAEWLCGCKNKNAFFVSYV
ncbi:hypothetical protein ASNO1_78240 [Corallococcus caeni]|uniref:Uncharacterized protein n=1 Tax=Corallococcus caeni TaxID=3082388 RepID=A0ABQ6R5I2_9BACT|nr:hypothetical protein ASNO1_78240 [Corallococcus sp. NO1]